MKTMPADFTFDFSDFVADISEPMNIKIIPINNKTIPIEIILFSTIFFNKILINQITD